MHPSVRQTLEFLSREDGGVFTIVSPFPLDEEEIRHLLEFPKTFVLIQGKLQDVSSTASRLRVRYFWESFVPAGKVIFLGGPDIVSVAELLKLSAFGTRSLHIRFGGRLQRRTFAYLFLKRGFDVSAYWLRLKHPSHLAARIIGWGLRNGIFKALRRSNVRINDVESFSDAADNVAFVIKEILGISAAIRRGESGAIPGRVLHVNAGLAAGGAERQICLTLTGLVKAGVSDVLLLSEYKDAADNFTAYANSLEAANIPNEAVIPVLKRVAFRELPPRVAASVSQLPAYLLPEVLSLYCAFVEKRPEVVHAWQDGTSIRSGLAAAIAGVPFIILGGRNMDPVSLPTFRPYLRSAYRELLKYPNVTLTNNSVAGAVAYATWLNIKVESVHVIHNGVAPIESRRFDRVAVRKLLGISTDATVVGGIFRIVPQKRPILWLETAAKLAQKNSNLHFVIAGEGPLKEEMRRNADELGLGKMLHLLGNVQDVSQLYAGFDVFLLTSSVEGLPNVLLEAQCAGVPIVCTDVGGNREAVRPDITAYVVKTATSDALENALSMALNDSAWQKAAVEAGRLHVKKNFSVEVMVEKTKELYGTMAHHNS